MRSRSRRRALVAAAVAATATLTPLAGCLGGSDEEQPSGTVVVDNRNDRSHSVSVTATPVDSGFESVDLNALDERRVTLTTPAGEVSGPERLVDLTGVPADTSITYVVSAISEGSTATAKASYERNGPEPSSLVGASFVVTVGADGSLVLDAPNAE